MSNAALFDDKKWWSNSMLAPWLVCLGAGCFFLYEFFQLNVFDVINVALRDDFNLDATRLSWLSSAYLWANLIFLLPAGMILDRYSVKKVIMVSLSICVLGTFGFAFARHFPLAFFCHFLTGIGNAFCFLSCVILVSRWFDPRRQGLVIGLIVTMAFVGGMLAHAPFAYLVMQLGWRSAVLLDGALGVVILFALGMILQDRPKGAKVENKAHTHTSFKTILCNQQTWLAGLYTSCLNLPIMVLCVLWGVNYLTEAHNLSVLAASEVVSLILIGSIFGCPLAGYMSDRQGKRKPLMLFCSLLSLAVVMLLVKTGPLSIAWLSLMFFLLGLFSGAQVIGYPVVAESNAAHATGTATALASMVIMGGGAVAQILFGKLLNLHTDRISGAYTAADFDYAMWLFPVAMGIAVLAVLKMKETHCKRVE